VKIKNKLVKRVKKIWLERQSLKDYFFYRRALTAKIVETCRLGRENPGEKFVNLPKMNVGEAEIITKVLNAVWSGSQCRRCWKVVEKGYKLK